MTNWHAKAVAYRPFEEEVIDALTKPFTMYPRGYEQIHSGHMHYLGDTAFENTHFSDVKIYLVGGAVREIVRGLPEKVKDWDFAIEADSFDQMRDWIKYQGFEIFVETPQYFTIRARASHEFTFAGMDMNGRTFDFTLCRTEGEYSDGRHPDKVSKGTITQDLSRRDFTMNAIAMDSSGTLVDPFGGQSDINHKMIRCVGTTERLEEDSLRMLRALRFAVQLDFSLTDDIIEFLYDPSNLDLLDNISQERVREELTKMFKANTLETLYYLQTYYMLTAKLFGDESLWLLPTVKGK